MPSHAFFASLVALPDVITGPGQYVTRCGDIVTINSAGGRAARFDCFGAYSDGTRESWHRGGRIMASCQTANDIVRPNQA
jgi:hypothetical protein